MRAAFIVALSFLVLAAVVETAGQMFGAREGSSGIAVQLYHVIAVVCCAVAFVSAILGGLAWLAGLFD